MNTACNLLVSLNKLIDKKSYLKKRCQKGGRIDGFYKKMEYVKVMIAYVLNKKNGIV